MNQESSQHNLIVGAPSLNMVLIFAILLLSSKTPVEFFENKFVLAFVGLVGQIFNTRI